MAWGGRSGREQWRHRTTCSFTSLMMTLCVFPSKLWKIVFSAESLSNWKFCTKTSHHYSAPVAKRSTEMTVSVCLSPCTRPSVYALPNFLDMFVAVVRSSCDDMEMFFSSGSGVWYHRLLCLMLLRIPSSSKSYDAEARRGRLSISVQGFRRVLLVAAGLINRYINMLLISLLPWYFIHFLRFWNTNFQH